MKIMTLEDHESVWEEGKKRFTKFKIKAIGPRFFQIYATNIANRHPDGVLVLTKKRKNKKLIFRKRFMPVGHGDEVVYGLLGANVAVFLLWKIVDPSFMRKHFMISLDNFKSGRLHTLITSAFSHSDFHHLLINMIGLYFFGSSIVSLFGPEFLLKLYLGGALGGSVFYLAHKAFMVPSSKGYRGWDESRIPALGASAAVNAIILLNVFLFPKNIYYVNLIIPVPAALLGAFLIGSDLWRIKKGDQHISGSAHLGGAVVAALVFARIKRWI